MKALDLQFLRRVYHTTGLLTLVLAGIFAVRWGMAAGLGVAAGSALMLVSLWTIERAVRRFMVPGVRDHRPLLWYVAAMYPALIATLWVIVQTHYLSPAAVAVGVAVPIAVIVLKVLGFQAIRQPDRA